MMPLLLLIFEIFQCIQYIYSITFIRRHLLRFFTFSPSLVSSVKNLPRVLSRESNSGLPYSKPTHCQLSYIYLQFLLHIQFQADCLSDSFMIAISYSACSKSLKFTFGDIFKKVNIYVPWQPRIRWRFW
jgi:hypothetical protein